MKATGIVRRIDDLGRVVIPKEIRRSFHIQEGDPLEIFTAEGMICFKKYDPIGKDKWEKVKNVLRYLLTAGFELENYKNILMEKYNQAVDRSNDYITIPIMDNNDVVGYIITNDGFYTNDELDIAVKMAKEILLH